MYNYVYIRTCANRCTCIYTCKCTYFGGGVDSDEREGDNGGTRGEVDNHTFLSAVLQQTHPTRNKGTIIIYNYTCTYILHVQLKSVFMHVVQTEQ